MRWSIQHGWSQLPQGYEVIHLDDLADDEFGYGINLDWPAGSEWGTPPFGQSADEELPFAS